ncbi:MAG: aromatic ring-hydroxylating dioxygenase subunit alpha [Planctomycetota bacterium]
MSELFGPTNAVFHDPALFAAELDLLRRSWICVGTSFDLPGPDTRFVYEDTQRSWLVTRDAQGGLHAFVNACTHRGTRLCGEHGQGRVQCPYHGWVFGTDGRLLGASKRKGFAELDEAQLGLRPLAAVQLGELLFVHEDASLGEADLRAFLGSEAERIARISAHAKRPLLQCRMPLQGNWKLAVSGAIEDYHVPFVHQQTLKKGRTSTAEDYELCPGGHAVFSTAAPLSGLVRALLRWLGGVEPLERFESHFVFPNLLVIQIVGVIHVTRFVPVSPGETLRVSQLYDISPRRSWLNPLEWLRALVMPLARRGIHKVFVEDREVLELAQRGTGYAQTLARGPAHLEEARVEHFLGEVRRQVDGEGAGAPAEVCEDPITRSP